MTILVSLFTMISIVSLISHDKLYFSLGLDGFLEHVGRSADRVKPFYCKLCNIFTSTRRNLVRNHVESIHFPGMFSYYCSGCNKSFNSNNALAVHTSTFHKR